VKLAVLAVGAPLVVAALWLGARYPIRGALAVYAGVVPFGSGLTLPIPLPSPFDTVSTMLGVVAIAAVAVQLALRHRRAERLLPEVPVFLVFAGVAAMTWFWSVNPSATGRNLNVLLSLVALFTVVALVRGDRGDVDVVTWAIIAGGCLVSAYGVYLLAAGRLAATADGVTRFATAGGVGEGTDPNITAAALLLPLVLITTKLVRGRMPAAMAGALLLVITAIFLTGSRGGLIAGAAGILTVLALERGRRLLVYAVPIALAAAVAFTAAPAGLQGRLKEQSSTGRSDIWKVGLRGCQEHCATGSGLGTFPDVYRATLLTRFDLGGHGLKEFKAHNIWLAMVVETGFAGLVLGATGVGLLLVHAWRLPRAARTGPFAGLVAVLVANLFLSNFVFKYFWLVLTYVVLAVLAETGTGEPAEEASAGAGDDRALVGATA